MNLFDLCVAKKLSGGGGGSDNTLNALITRDITQIESDAENVGAYAFYRCVNLVSASFPQATAIKEAAFYACTALSTADIPQPATIEANAFYECANLTDAYFPQVTTIGVYAFYKCTRLTVANIPQVTLIKEGVFYGCTNLTAILLRDRATLNNRNAIPASAIVYVDPNDLEWYSTATNWETIYADGRIKSIEEFPG